MKNHILMTGVGSYLPNRKVSNADLSKYVDTSDEWITQRSGIKYRHFIAKNEMTSDLATKAALKALDDSKLKPTDIDLIIIHHHTHLDFHNLEMVLIHQVILLELQQQLILALLLVLSYLLIQQVLWRVCQLVQEVVVEDQVRLILEHL